MEVHQRFERLLQQETSAPIERIETHISQVYLVGDRAYKLKKPVNFEFLDFSSIEARRAACESELRLNRRLAGDVYEAVVPIFQRADGELTWDTSGQPVDWVVRMQRLDTSRTLEEAIQRGELRDSDLQSLCDHLNRFYRSARPVPETTAQYRASIEQHVHGNFIDLLAPEHAMSRRAVLRTHGAQLRLLRLQADLFDQRVADHKVIDGHGDLRPEHVVLGNPPVVFDCIEFSEDLRRIDIADELAFLGMECERLGAPQVGDYVWQAYLKSSGDWAPDRLRHFYMSYRACVRAKVAALRADQLSTKQHDQSLATAEQYLEIADQHARELPGPVLFVVCGKSGTGKSTLSRELTKRLAAEQLSTDQVRQEMFGVSTAPEAIGQGNYRLEKRQAVYGAMFDQARQLLQAGISPVLDGTFLQASLRTQAIELAKEAEAAAWVIHCHCPDNIAAQRIAARLERGNDASEARPKLIAKQHLDPLPSDSPSIEVDTTQSLAAQVETVFRQLRH